jgi:hypothetical protein
MRVLLSLLFAALLSACSSDPALPLSDDRLVKILADAHIAEAAVQSLSGPYKDSVIRVYYTQICEIHQVSEADFYQSVELLAMQPEKMDKIYRKVEQRLEALAEEFKTVEQ